jgi:His/Glu/Gln/Arg/opine family amino acid ABC transporter permease subunit
MWSWAETLAPGLWLTIGLWIVASATILPIALAVAMGRLSSRASVRRITAGYIELLRSTPMLGLMLFTYFGLGSWVGPALTPFLAAYLALVVGQTAYDAENYRAAFQSVPETEWEAAHGLGLTRWQTYRFIILPRSIPVLFAPTVNSWIYVIKMTAIASVISVTELTLQSTSLVGTTYRPLPVYALVAVFYLVLITLVGALGRYGELITTRRLGAWTKHV